MCPCRGGAPALKSACFLHADACPTHPDLPASVCQCACIYVVSFPRMLGVLRAPQRASGASSEKRETTSAPPWAAPRNARRRDAEARGPSRARVPAPTCVWVDSQTEPLEGRGKTKRTSDCVDDIESNPERPGILDEICRRRHELSTPLTNLSATERKHNSTGCALWSLPRIFSFLQCACMPIFL